MRTRTIDYNYDYQMGQAIKALLEDYETSPNNFTPEQLVKFLWDDSEGFGRKVIEKMQEWADDEDWMEAAKSA